MSSSLAAQHSEWLSLVEISGPFLTLPVLKRALPLGLDPTPLPLVDDLRVAWSEVGDDDSLIPRWIRWVLHDLLELPDDVVKEGADIGPALTYTVPEHGIRLRPDFAIVDPDAAAAGPARMLVTALPAGTKLDERLADSKWSADAIDRMAELCRGTAVRVGLVTNGDQWALVDAPVGGATGVATWDANLWLEERLTLDAFTTLLGVRRFFSVAANDTLDAMFSESANAEAEVTDQLGKQVRAAVELLVDAMSRSNRDRGGRLFDELTSAEVYEAAVTVMMRLVFLLSAEERGLFLLGDETYDSTYAVSTLRAQLEEDANAYGEEVIARRTDAWHRLLATFRMVFAGAQHENLRLPAYGGSLFDPDRFPFLEGRHAGERWRSTPSNPLPIDNRTVLHILGALQILTFKERRGVTEARRLSFRALDVEQIGHVYEGLLDHSAMRVDEPAVGLSGKNEPEIALELIEVEAERGQANLVNYLADQTGLSEKAVEKALTSEPGSNELERLISSCDNDRSLANRVSPYLSLLRLDLADLPVVYLPNSMYVTQSSDRRSSGTYYTPRVLAEEVVLYTLEPLVYSPGPVEGAEPTAWKLKASTELLDLKICDMAMGSGAFLVATCRYLSARLLEAWETEGFGAGDPIPLSGGASLVMPLEENDREVLARRMVADSCIYGVDRNPMAVEMAKLSIWLFTLAKDRPFTFVDHALRLGDSLLGITDLHQLDCLHLDPAAGKRLHGGTLFDPAARMGPLAKGALEKRRQLESFPVLDVRDAERKRRLLNEASALLGELKVIGDVVVGAALSSATQSKDAQDRRLLSVASEVIAALDPEWQDNDREQRLFDLRLKAEYWLDEGRPGLAPDRQCLHWPLEYPEVFLDGSRTGFDAVVGNPPFLGGVRITELFGDEYAEYLSQRIGSGLSKADLCSYFFRRAASIVLRGGDVGLLATKTISQGITRRNGLDVLNDDGFAIYRARKSFPWPGSAAVVIAAVWLSSVPWRGLFQLDGTLTTMAIDPLLESAGATSGTPHRLAENADLAFQGSSIYGEHFFVDKQLALQWRSDRPENVQVVKHALGGRELNNSTDFTSERWIIDMEERNESEARSYPEVFEYLERNVRTGRLELDPTRYHRIVESWWKFWHPRLGLYRGISALRLERVLVRSRVSDHHMVAFVETQGIVYTEAVVVFLLEEWHEFAVLQSVVHDYWARRYASTLKADVRYQAPDCFQTFPFPEWQPETRKESAEAGQHMYEMRSELMRSNAFGLTKVHNRVHDVRERNGFDNLRSMIVAQDMEVVRAYGWSDIELDHDFHETPRGIRFTVAPAAQRELLDRLLQLNHERYSREGSHRVEVVASAAGRPRGSALQLTIDDE